MPSKPDYWDKNAAFHKRLHRRRGNAKDYQCVDCDKQAWGWSHIHFTEADNYDNYEPRCQSCHKKYDMTTETRANIARGRMTRHVD